MSDDGRFAVVVIALLGNPFSPAYARARAAGAARALDHAAMNVAVYARRASAWSLREHRIAGADASADGVSIGSSTMRWDGDRLVANVRERATPFGRAIRGTVAIHPRSPPERGPFAIDQHGEHRWWLAAPLARIEVDLPEPGVRFTGHGYHDANAGSVPLETTFEAWSWSRARDGDGALVTYEVEERSGAGRTIALRAGPRGELEDLFPPTRVALGRTGWGLARRAPADQGHEARLVRSLEDGPFYARSLVETRLRGRPALLMHETLAAHRLRQRWVRFLSGFRMGTGP